MPHFFTILLATWFGTGKSPKAPGTVGSLAALPFAFLITHYFWGVGLLAASLVLFIIGIFVSKKYQILSHRQDPGEIVIDEVVGQWITLVGAPLHWKAYLAGFILFRLFDIWKPFPIGWLDRKVKGGFGVMLDDVLAGIFGFILLQALVFYGIV